MGEPEITCLRFPDEIAQLLQQVPTREWKTLQDAFRPLLSTAEHDLLNQAAVPSQCQLRMTMFLLRKQHNLVEVEAENPEMDQLLRRAVERCPSYTYKGARRDD